MHETPSSEPLDLAAAAAPEMPPGLRTGGLGALVLAAVIVVGGLALRAWHAREAQGWAAEQAIVTVKVVHPMQAAAGRELVLPGTLAAWDSARIFARVPGYIRAWYRDIGAPVRAGEALGAIDAPELDQQIIQARAALARAEAEARLAGTTAARWTDLLKSASVSQQEADEKTAGALTRRAAVREAQAALGRLLAMKAYSVVRAPFTGVVTARSTDIGDLVGPGAASQHPMFEVADEQRLRVYVNVPQQDAGLMRPGVTARLSVPDWPGRVFTASLAATSAAINAQSGALQVQLVLPNPDHALRSGGYAQVHFALPSSGNTLTIPASALLLRGDGTRVATLDRDGKVHLATVTIGRDLGNVVEIASGLTRDASVVDNPPDSIAEGQRVRISHGAS